MIVYSKRSKEIIGEDVFEQKKIKEARIKI